MKREEGRPGRAGLRHAPTTLGSDGDCSIGWTGSAVVRARGPASSRPAWDNNRRTPLFPAVGQQRRRGCPQGEPVPAAPAGFGLWGRPGHGTAIFFHYTAGNFIVGKEEKESMFPLYATMERNKEDGHDEMSGKIHGPGSLCLLLVLLAGCRVDQRQRDGKTGASPVRISEFTVSSH